MTREIILQEIDGLKSSELKPTLDVLEQELKDIKHILSYSLDKPLDKNLSDRLINLQEKKRLLNFKLQTN